GEDNRHITQVDEGGVAFAAIQGLNQKLEEELKKSGSEITFLRAQWQTKDAQLAGELQKKDAQIARDHEQLAAQQRQIEDLQQQMRTMMARVEAVEKTSATHAGISLVSSSR
ncbi:MAG TPA: hypothetical protein VK129_11800, partial [Terriglobales bacterium]|nr:hypothetical protein [Terriglobales bacterium]